MKKIIIALLVFLIIGIAAFQLNVKRVSAPDPVQLNSTSTSPVTCIEEAIQCPDGSLVGRSGPDCDFEACPVLKTFSQIGNLIFKNSSWYLIYEKPGAPALEVKIIVKAGSDLLQYKTGDRVKITGDLTNTGVLLSTIEKLVDNNIDCPQLSPIGPNFCPNGKIEAGVIGTDGCQLPPKCVTASVNDCVVGGCNNTLCGEKGDSLVSICDARPEYQCYKQAVCERQITGKCDWTKTEPFNTCMAIYQN